MSYNIHQAIKEYSNRAKELKLNIRSCPDCYCNIKYLDHLTEELNKVEQMIEWLKELEVMEDDGH